MIQKKLITKTFQKEAYLWQFVSTNNIQQADIQFSGALGGGLYQLSYWSY